MYLDAVKKIEVTTIIATDSPETECVKTTETSVFEKWKNWQASEISHHGKLCCEIAREWITATDFSALGGASIQTGPRWLRQRFNWGASSFPIYWCEAVRKKTLDCGALAALAHEVFTARGVKTYRAQMVQRFSKVSTEQWTKSWGNNHGETVVPLAWAQEDLIYHEGCAISAPGSAGEIKVWDASAGWWIDPNSKNGYGSLLALRLSAYNLEPAKKFVWGEYEIPAFEWIKTN